ncbi:hypothetical protein FDP41_001384 [Naegleria fowleri]|uniref:GTP-binding nuclear protein n=1 Tax=Naegleria fowleri TaxID=5763 RepID=A0A6A5BWL3_NAEFO|nr:uncharacterized protein FDP41_001384 [Naegleria fowleri]KAF0979716.1 hypothetical protein FDP41_001384 [Naegleria fowleri]
MNRSSSTEENESADDDFNQSADVTVVELVDFVNPGQSHHFSDQLFTKFKSHMREPVHIFKLIVVGSSMVGKTSFINRFILDPKIMFRHLSDIHTTIFPITFASTKGKIRFEVWDYQNENNTSNDVYNDILDDHFHIPCDKFFQHAHCAILMFDITSRLSYKMVPQWYRKVLTLNPERVPSVVLCGNKVDVMDRKVKRKFATFHRKRNIEYHDVSARVNYCIVEPLLSLAKKLLNCVDLTFDNTWSAMLKKPQEVTIDSSRRLEIMQSEHMYYHDTYQMMTMIYNCIRKSCEFIFTPKNVLMDHNKVVARKSVCKFDRMKIY